ncbi:MAG TPA: hypothetical protein VK772_07910 [Puia sp.]|jgi:hypothetical protein|nr:hypothetical protein [Puia sp.]
MTIEYTITDKHLQTSILNTIRVINEYRLDKKKYLNNTYKILIPSKGIFYQYQVFKKETGSQLKIYAGFTKGTKITETNAVAWINLFLTNLDSVISGQVVLTPEMINKDVYKSSQFAFGLLQLIILIVAVIAIATALLH